MCVCVCVYLGFIAFPSNEYQTFQKIIKLEYEFPEGFPECPKDLVQSLLVSFNIFWKSGVFELLRI